MRKQELSGVVGLQTGAAGLESRVAASVTLQTRTPGVRGPLLASDRGDCPAGHGSAAEGRRVRAKRPRPAAWRPGAVGVLWPEGRSTSARRMHSAKPHT